MRLEPDIEAHYAAGREHGRLTSSPSGRLEFERSKAILRRYLPSPPARVLDVGGGTGPYAMWLADSGYEVELVDAMESHIEFARTLPEAAKLSGLRVGDARSLSFDDASFDGVLMMGPLYHLVSETDRVQALREAHRVLRPGGMLAAVVISRLASILDGYFGGLIDDPVFQTIVRDDLDNGLHRNPTGNPAYFATAKFHAPAELEDEMRQAGFGSPTLIGIEGFGWLLPDLATRIEGDQGEMLMDFLARVETEPSFVGASAHIMGIART
jgi:ubiquinone/menaquinone biosynthesis C-methylase UbiE